MSCGIDKAAVERQSLTAIERLRLHVECDLDAPDADDMLHEVDALTAHAEKLERENEALRAGLETSKKYSSAYQECDRIASAKVHELEEREKAVAGAAWIEGRDAVGATFGAHAMLIFNVQPPTDAAAALARREDDVWNEAVEAACGETTATKAEDSTRDRIRALKRSGKETG